MNIEDFRVYCLWKKGVTEEFPFDESTLVFKVMGKMFALSGLDRFPIQANLKCDPEYAIELRASYDQIIAGFHMNKKHWNTINLEDGLDDTLILELIDHSYDLVVKGMTKKLKEALSNL